MVDFNDRRDDGPPLDIGAPVAPKRAAAMRWGCDDCGEMYAKKADIKPHCAPYTDKIRRGKGTITGYEWSG